MQATSFENIEVQDPEPVNARGTLSAVMGSLGWPIVLGLVGFWTFLFLVQNNFITNELLIRYLTAHPVSYVATAMFFVGMAGLTIKFASIFHQITDQKNVQLSAAPALAQRADSSRRLLDELADLSPSQQGSYMGTRLRTALEFVDKTETAVGLEDELKYLSDMDAGRQQESYALIRILIWAIPMLGFLGTVVGISGALGGLSVASDFELMLSGLRDKLYVAFDTTALALTLSIILMFVQFIVNRIETQHLSAVDDAVAEQLIGRFETFGTHRDPYLSSVENMSRKVLSSISDINEQQSELWQSGLNQIRDTTEGVLSRFAEVLASRLADQLDPVMDEIGVSVRAAINDSQAVMDSHSRKVQQAMEDSVEMLEIRNQRLLEMMGKQSVGFQDLLESQSRVLKGAMDHSDNVVAGHMLKLDQSLEKSLTVMENANVFMENQSETLHGIVTASSQMMEEHSRKISDAVTRSEEIVDKRQETIAQTQESMLKAQTQQSMAISKFTESLEVLQETVEQSQSLEKMQASMQNSIEDLQKSDSLIHEIKGLAKVVSNQVAASDSSLRENAEAITAQAKHSMEQIRACFEENAESLAAYQLRQEQVISSVIQAKLSLDTDSIVNSLDQNTAAASKSTATLETNFELLAEQMNTQFQALAELGTELKGSSKLEESVADLKNTLMSGLRQLNHTVASQDLSGNLTEKLEGIEKALLKPTPHQQQFLDQQRQTIENQSELLDFCQTIEVNNRSSFLESAKQILNQHAETASKAVELEETVRDLTFSINLLNQSIAKQTNDAAVSSLQFRQPDIPKRVA